MKRWRYRMCFTGIVMLLGAMAVFSQERSGMVEGTVTGLYRLAFPRVRVVLQMSDGKRVVGEPSYRYKGESPDFSDPATTENLGCYYWLPGDRVRVRLTRQGDGGQTYLFSEARRLGAGRIPGQGQRPPRQEAPPQSPGTPPQRREQPVENKSENRKEGIVATLSTNQARYAPGEPVRIRITFKNDTGELRKLLFSSGQRFDIVAERDGRTVWQWSRGRMFTMALGTLTLAPGQSFAAEEVWDQKSSDGQPVGPGQYTLIARLTARESSGFPEARGTVEIGGDSRSSTSIRDILDEPERFIGKTVTVEGQYRGWKPDPEAPQCRMGPPVTRSDWAVQDDTGTLYVTGKSLYDPLEDIGKPLRVVATVRKNEEKGQIYLHSREVSELSR